MIRGVFGIKGEGEIRILQKDNKHFIQLAKRKKASIYTYSTFFGFSKIRGITCCKYIIP
jgi:hypothetical protein